MKKVIITLCISLLTSFALNATAAENKKAELTPEHMTCKEFVDLNPQTLAPVAMWTISQKADFKGGDVVSLSEQSIAEVPLIIEYCKTHPSNSLKDYIGLNKK